MKWWEEIELYEELLADLQWCCKLFLEGDFEEFIEQEIGIYVGSRLHLNFCPHCGRQIGLRKPANDYNFCCYLFRDLGLEGMQFEEFKADGRTEIHRLKMNYCFNCGNDLREFMKQPKDTKPQWKGDKGCDGCHGGCV